MQIYLVFSHANHFRACGMMNDFSARQFIIRWDCSPQSSKLSDLSAVSAKLLSRKMPSIIWNNNVVWCWERTQRQFPNKCSASILITALNSYLFLKQSLNLQENCKIYSLTSLISHVPITISTISTCKSPFLLLPLQPSQPFSETEFCGKLKWERKIGLPKVKSLLRGAAMIAAILHHNPRGDIEQRMDCHCFQ